MRGAVSTNYIRTAAAVAVLAPAAALGQIPRTPAEASRALDKNATRIMILTFVSSDSGSRATLGHKAAAEMRAQLSAAVPVTELYVIPDTPPITMETSQFPPAEPLAPIDAQVFALMLRADEHVVGSIERIHRDKFRVTADLVLTRDLNARQPLGVGESKSIPDAIKTLVREMKQARKQLAGERLCTNAVREGKFSQAITAAQTALSQYPKATIARMCLASALNASKAPQDSVLKVAREILALDPRNHLALRLLPADERRKYPPDSLPPDTTQAMQRP